MENEELRKEIEELKRQNDILIKYVHNREKSAQNMFVNSMLIILVFAVGFMFFNFIGYEDTFNDFRNDIDSINQIINIFQ